MNEKAFCYWLQGFMELTDTEELTKEQVCMIKSHLALVFTKGIPPLKIDKIIQDQSWRLKDPFPLPQVLY